MCKVTETSLLEYCHTGIGQFKFESCPFSTEALIALFSIQALWYDSVRDEVESHIINKEEGNLGDASHMISSALFLTERMGTDLQFFK